MKRIKIILAAALLSTQAPAQTINVPGNVADQQSPASSPFVRGAMTIDFGTVSRADANGKIPQGAADTYTLNINVDNSVAMHGTIVRLPYIDGGLLSHTQPGSLAFDINTDVINPKNPNQKLNIGIMAGAVPVDKQNVYHFDQGNLIINTFNLGRAIGINSKFEGVAAGRPPNSSSLIDKIKKIPISISRSIHGQTVTVIVARYDTMVLTGHVLAAGPIQIYPATAVSGNMLFDYDRNCWDFHGMTCNYSVNGQPHTDTITGDIRWTKDADWAHNGKNQYSFDVRVNEPPPSEAAAFSAPTNEGDFFAVDDSIQGMTGTIAYTDRFQDPTHPTDDSVIGDSVTIDLVGSHLTKQQTMYLVKLLLFSCIVPMNSD